jgi:O-glycosyl hydrolase
MADRLLGWMKLNGVQEGTTVNNNLNPAYSGPYAEYFVQYIQRFAKMGVTVNAITIQNEPLNSNAGFPTMYVSADNATSKFPAT